MSHTKQKDWHPSSKSRRCYHRVISGIERGGTLRFLTLTSSNESPLSCQRDFRALYMRLKRRGLIEGYIKVPELSKNGKQHLHVLFRGKYIPQKLLSEWWQQLHQAKVVDIRRVNSDVDKRKLASDMASYMSKANLYRYSWNWTWVWKGFVKDWTNLKRWFWQHNRYAPAYPFSWLLNHWHICLVHGHRPKLKPYPDLR